MDGLDALDKETACEERGGPETGGWLQARFAGNAAGLAPAVPRAVQQTWVLGGARQSPVAAPPRLRLLQRSNDELELFRDNIS